MKSNDILKFMGLRIAAKRKQLGQTQETLAEKIDVTPQMISYAETGKKAMRPENIIKICEALNMSADYLLTGKEAEHEDTLYKNLATLPQEQLIYIEAIINNCIALCRTNQ